MIFRDEAQNLAEWLEYHLMLGVEHFFLYSHMSQDNYKKVLRPYIKAKQVTLIEWNFPRRRVAPGGGGPFPQTTAYDHALGRLRGVARWIVVIDSDEFVVQMTELTLTEFLAQHEDKAGVALNWALFGTSGHKTKPAGLSIENYTFRAPRGSIGNKHVKTIINPLCVRKSKDPHQWEVGRTETGILHTLVNGKGDNIPPQPERTDRCVLSGSHTAEVTWDLFRINHYVRRSEEEYRHKIEVRGRLSTGTGDEKEWLATNGGADVYNDKEDTYMLKYVSELRKRLKGSVLPYAYLAHT